MPGAKTFTYKQWHAMLEAADGVHMTSSQPLRAEMLENLKLLLADSQSVGIEIEANTLTSAPALWKGVAVNLNTQGQMDTTIVQEVMWELYEIRFRLEVVSLDRYMVPEPLGDSDEADMLREAWYEREMIVHHCWPGLAHAAKYVEPGLSSYRPLGYRVRYLKGLFNLIRGWPGLKPQELRLAFPPEDDQVALIELEEALANYYTRIFLKVFHRPPSVPHAAL